MGGLGVFAWLAIGTAAGWVISRLMVTAGDDALRGTAAGMIGGILGGLGIRLLDPPPGLGNSPVTALAAALAGSLWLTWLTCVVTSGRERRSQPRTPAARFTRGEATPDAEQAPSATRFDTGRHPSLGTRVQALAARMRPS